MRRYTVIREGFDFKGKHLHRNLFVIFRKYCYKSFKSISLSSLFLTDGCHCYEILRDILYSLGIGVAVNAMLSIPHSSVPLRILK